MNLLFTSIKRFASIALTVSIVVGLVWVALPTGSAAAAANPTTQPNAAPTGAQPAPRLERAFTQEQAAQARQGKVLDRADTVATKAAAFIAKLKQAGKDVSGLEKILATFKASVDSARLIHDQAAGILNHHPGFDASGTVTDRVQAQQTVKDVHGLQVQFRQGVWPAIRDLLKAVRDLRKGNQASPTAAPTATPNA